VPQELLHDKHSAPARYPVPVTPALLKRRKWIRRLRWFGPSIRLLACAMPQKPAD
jgi:hypothetical protein